MKENVLIIYCSGGNGLIQAAEAKKQEILLNNPEAKIIQKDLLVEWFPKPIGKMAAKTWDNAQKRGSIRLLEVIRYHQRLSEFLFWPHILLKTLKILIKKDIDRVIDTQPVSPGPIIKAIRIANYYRKKNVFLEKVAVDLPTDLNTHYFKPIKKLSEKDRRQLLLYTIDPLLKENESEKEFWKRNCNLPLSNIRLQKYFIRQSFKKYQKLNTINESVLIKVKCHAEEEALMTKDVLKDKPIDFTFKNLNFEYSISANDLVYTILLGSQPAYEASISYLKGFLDLASKTKKSSRHIVFIFCSKHNSKKDSLFKIVSDFLISNNNLKNLIIIPLSFQTDAVIAPIFSRSNATFTRSGGQTVMELMGVMHGKIFIHTEVKGKINRKKLLKGLFAWETGSAIYLEQKRGASIVTPKTFEKHLESFF